MTSQCSSCAIASPTRIDERRFVWLGALASLKAHERRRVARGLRDGVSELAQNEAELTGPGIQPRAWKWPPARCETRANALVPNLKPGTQRFNEAKANNHDIGIFV